MRARGPTKISNGTSSKICLPRYPRWQKCGSSPFLLLLKAARQTIMGSNDCLATANEDTEANQALLSAWARILIVPVIAVG